MCCEQQRHVCCAENKLIYIYIYAYQGWSSRTGPGLLTRVGPRSTARRSGAPQWGNASRTRTACVALPPLSTAAPAPIAPSHTFDCSTTHRQPITRLGCCTAHRQPIRRLGCCTTYRQPIRRLGCSTTHRQPIRRLGCCTTHRQPIRCLGCCNRAHSDNLLTTHRKPIKILAVAQHTPSQSNV